MRLHNFFVKDPITEDEFVVKDENLLNQWRNVLRLKKGNKVILLDNTEFEFECVVDQLEKNWAILTVSKKTHKPWQPAFDLEIIQSVIKKDRFEWLLEKGTELGVNKFSPVFSERCVRQKINMERAEKILKESSEQSGRSKLPEINIVRNLDDALKEREEGRFYIALDPKGKSFDKKFLKSQKIGFFIGPEGGFDDSELKTFSQKEIPVYSLGSQTLRAETAAVAIVSVALLSH